MTQLKEVHDFWNSESCGERYAIGKSDLDKFISEEKKRYELEPYIKDFASFNLFKGLDVLEIGVGFGSDHSQIALNQPKSLTGIDLTERAINNTKIRFELLDLQSNLLVDNAENLSFESESFDALYSYGVLHHSPNTKKCFEEVYRVLRPGGFAKIMIYHKYSIVGFMLWLRYGLFLGKPFTKLEEIYSNYLESPGTKAYSLKEAKRLTEQFSSSDFKVQLSFGDLLRGDVGARHKGFWLTLARIIFPAFIIKILNKFFPIGLFLLITLKK